MILVIFRLKETGEIHRIDDYSEQHLTIEDAKNKIANWKNDSLIPKLIEDNTVKEIYKHLIATKDERDELLRLREKISEIQRLTY